MSAPLSNFRYQLRRAWQRRRMHARSLRSALSCMVGELGRRNSDDRPTVVFVHENAATRVRSHGLALRSEGWKTILLTRLFDYAFQKPGFDEIHICSSSRHLSQKIKSIANRSDLRGVVGSIYAPLSLEPLIDMARSWPVFVDHHDSAFTHITLLGADPVKMESISRWFGPQQVNGEERCLRKADGVIARWNDLLLAMKKAEIRTPSVLLEDHTSSEFFEPVEITSGPKGQEWSIVYAGVVWPMAAPSSYFASAQFAGHGPAFRKERLHLHIYPSPNNEFVLTDHMREARQNPYFHMNRAISTARVHKTLAKHDFGLTNYQKSDISKYQAVEHQKCIVNSKFIAYIEAGLPVLVQSCYERMAEIVSSTGSGIVYDNDGPEGLRQRIENADVADMRGNVLALRKSMLGENRGAHLKAFINETKQVVS